MPLTTAFNGPRLVICTFTCPLIFQTRYLPPWKFLMTRWLSTSPVAAQARAPLDDRFKAMGPSVRQSPPVRGWIRAIREALGIGSERIGHALSAGQDFYLLQDLREREIPLELNLTSNVRTGLCRSYAAHPLRKYFDAGLLISLNSDAPAFFGSDLANEYLLAHTELGFTRDELRQLAANSIRSSFLPEAEKTEWLFRIDALR